MRAGGQWKLAAVLALVIPLSAACKAEDRDDGDVADDRRAMAEDASDANAAETNGQLLTSTLIAGAGSGTLSVASASDLLTGDLAPADVGDTAKALYFPRGCLTVTHDPATRNVTYVFAGCFGPNGLARVRGEVKVAYVAEAGKLTLELVATELQVNGATLDWSAHAEVVADGVARTMRWQGQVSGTTRRGRELARTTDKTLAWTVGERCFALSGVSEGRVRSRNLRVAVSDFRRCQGGCPEAGGRITSTNLDTGASVEVRFDGSDTATFTDATGGEVALPLSCNAG